MLFPSMICVNAANYFFTSLQCTLAAFRLLSFLFLLHMPLLLLFPQILILSLAGNSLPKTSDAVSVHHCPAAPPQILPRPCCSSLPKPSFGIVLVSVLYSASQRQTFRSTLRKHSFSLHRRVLSHHWDH